MMFWGKYLLTCVLLCLIIKEYILIIGQGNLFDKLFVIPEYINLSIGS